MTRPLEGLSVVEGTAFVAAPSGGMTLAQLGADVIRFDQVGGGLDHRRWPLTYDGVSLYWNGLNRGKRSLAVDLRDPEVTELLADVDKVMGTAYLADQPDKGYPRRISYLIDPEGGIVRTYDLAGQDLAEHATAVLDDIRALS